MSADPDAAAVRFFPPGVPLAAIILGYALDRLVPLELGMHVPAPLRYWLGGGLSVVAVLVFGLWAVVLFRKGGQDENPWKPTPHIEQRGPFSISRNPMYLQMVLVCLGIGIASMNWWTILFTPLVGWLLWIVAIKPEEAYLTQKFGDLYLDYKCRVRRWI